MICSQRDIKLVIYVAIVITILQISYRIAFESDAKASSEVVAKSKQILYENVESESERISYEDEKFIQYEARRRGPGEQGVPFNLTDPKEIEENEKWYKIEGFYVTVSEKISVDRALPDKRPKA